MKYLTDPLQYDYIILNDLKNGINACKEQRGQDYDDNPDHSYFAPKYADCLEATNRDFFQTAYPEALHTTVSYNILR